MMINTKLINWLIENDNISAYRISKDSGISQQLLGKYRKGETEVEAMSIKTAGKLSNVAEKYFDDEVEKAIRFINHGATDGVMLSEVFSVGELQIIINADLQLAEGERTLTGDDEDLKAILAELNNFEVKYAYVLETADPDFEQHVVPFDFDHMQELSQEFHSLLSLHKLLSGTSDLLPDLN